eukprot:1443942-Pleurochrysis_carterae.AAC.1
MVLISKRVQLQSTTHVVRRRFSSASKPILRRLCCVHALRLVKVADESERTSWKQEEDLDTSIILN